MNYQDMVLMVYLIGLGTPLVLVVGLGPIGKSVHNAMKEVLFPFPCTHTRTPAHPHTYTYTNTSLKHTNTTTYNNPNALYANYDMLDFIQVLYINDIPIKKIKYE